MIDVKPPEPEGHHHTADCQWFECRLNNEIERLKTELADSDGQVQTLHADAKVLREQVATARALAFEEAARWCDERAKAHEAIATVEENFKGLAHAGGMAAMQGAAEHFRALAPMPAELVAVPARVLETLRASAAMAIGELEFGGNWEVAKARLREGLAGLAESRRLDKQG